MANSQTETSHCWDLRSIRKLIDELKTVRSALVAFESSFAARLDQFDAHQRISAANLLHYVALRRHDLRGLQASLAQLGLSSLGRAEPHVLANINAVLHVLTHMAGGHPSEERFAQVDYASAAALLNARAEALLGREPEKRSVRIMVTLSTEAAHDYALVKEMVTAGMDCARINCAHDEESAWKAMAGNVRRAAEEVRRPCRILMDLAGAKLRIGAIEAGPQVFKLKPGNVPFAVER